jgi:superfamily II DNA or RNA helicase
MLKDLQIKPVYRSDVDHILQDFYVPALRESVKYDRAVGFFSAGMLSYAAQGLSAFVENDGKMRLIIGGELQPKDAQAIEEGYATREISQKFGAEFLETIGRVTDDIFQRRLELLSWLIACGRLDIKVALKQRGMYHEKIGIFTDADNDKIVFQGSANETTNALLPDFNFESITVFQSWREELEGYFQPFMFGFENLWENRTLNTHVIDFPEAAKEKLISIANKHPKPINATIELDLWEKLQNSRNNIVDDSHLPHIPKTFNGGKFEIREHQRLALQSWSANTLTGTMALATGAGKTITAIYGAVKIFESENRLFLAIAVPYQSLADQWVDTLREFNIFPIKCYASSQIWLQKLRDTVSLYVTGALDFACVVVVNRTLQSENFQALIKQIPGTHFLWIGDECHHHGSEGLSQSLPQNADMRMGLSATPENYFNDEITQRILDYYGPIVSTYTLKQALEDEVLTPYKYYVNIVDLTEDETVEYQELSEKISRIIAINNNEVAQNENEALKTLLFKRARLLGKARNKFLELQKLLAGKTSSTHTLFYCGDGSTEDEVSGETFRQVEIVTSILRELNWKSSIFTSQETRQDRALLLDFFRLGLIDALVAIRCLDEGIDVPACKTAYILASSRNPKQFIQRRGRILRRAPGKEYAEIYDFVVKIPDEFCQNNDYEMNLVRSELERVSEFAKLSLNQAEAIRTLNPILKKYSLSHLIV